MKNSPIFSIRALAAAALLPLAALAQGPDQLGQWSGEIKMENVPIHVSLLPNGKVLYWSRREWAADRTHPLSNDLDPHECIPRLWDPKTQATTRTNPEKPKDSDGHKINLFCAGHTFLPDGRLLVTGGHIADGKGLNLTTTYDFATNTWTPSPAKMSGGRWYPTLVSLPDGTAVVAAGGDENGQPNRQQQILKNGAWANITDFNNLPFYPRMHLTLNGDFFMSGPLNLTQFLRPTGTPLGWAPLQPDGRRNRDNGDLNALQEYGCSVFYRTTTQDPSLLWVGGGIPPTERAKTINLKNQGAGWQNAASMKFRRRQHNATMLPDGTVLVTGGTQGDGGPQGGFNDLNIGSPIRAAERWDPATNTWTVLAEEGFDRCYHSTAILLPDATVLSAGGGEYRPDGNAPNDPKDSHLNAQIFSPPYLFKGPRPVISSAPASVRYNQAPFTVTTPQPGDIAKISIVGLSSVTHSWNSGQRLAFLTSTVDNGQLKVTAPTDPNDTPPGFYMLFLLNSQGVPSIATFLKIEK